MWTHNFLSALGNGHVASRIHSDRSWRVDSVSFNGPDPQLFNWFLSFWIFLIIFYCLCFFIWFILGSGIFDKIIGNENLKIVVLLGQSLDFLSFFRFLFRSFLYLWRQSDYGFMWKMILVKYCKNSFLHV